MITSAAAVAGNVAVGGLAGFSWPFVYFAGYAIAAEAGWVVGDPTVTDDGVGFTIGVGVIVLVVVGGLFAAVNVATRGRLPVALLISVTAAVVVSGLVY